MAGAPPFTRWVVDADEAEPRLTAARPAVRLQSNIAP